MYSCDRCKRKYVRKQKLLEHYLKVHGEGKDSKEEDPKSKESKESEVPKKSSKKDVEELKEQLLLLKAENASQKSAIETMRIELARPIIVLPQPN